jgi:hypothetical protein
MNIERIKIRTERYAEEIGPSSFARLAGTRLYAPFCVMDSERRLIAMAVTGGTADLLTGVFSLASLSKWGELEVLREYFVQRFSKYKVRGHVLQDGNDIVQALFTNLTDAAFIRDLLPMLNQETK